MRLATARSRARSSLLAAVLATVALLVGTLVGSLAWLQLGVRDSVVAAIDAAPVDARSAIVSTTQAEDAAAQARAADELFARLFGDAIAVEHLPATGTDGGVRWRLSVDPGGLDAWSVQALAGTMTDLDREVRRTEGLAVQGSSVEGALADTLEDAAADVGAVLSVVPVPLFLVVIGGVIAVLQLAGLLGAARAGEASLLRARGLSPAAARRAAVAESVVVAAAGSLPGALCGAIAVAAVSRSPDGIGVGAVDALAATWFVPVVATLGVGLAAGLTVRRAEDTPADVRAGRAARAVSGIAAGLLVLAAAVFVWQLRGYADADTSSAGAWGVILTAVTPALALGAATIIVLALFGPAAAAVARASASRTDLVPALPARMVARHVGAFAVVVVMVALATGGALYAGASIATWDRAAHETAALDAGGTARAAVPPERVTPRQVADVADSADVSAAAAALTHAARVSDTELELLALPVAQVASVVAPVPGAGVDPAALAGDLGGEEASVGVPLPAATAGIVLQGALRGRPAAQPDLLVIRAWYLDARGTPASAPVELELTADPTAPPLPIVPAVIDPTNGEVWFEAHPDLDQSQAFMTMTGVVPDGAGPWTLIGVDVAFRAAPGSASATMTFDAVVTDAGTAIPMPTDAPVIVDAQSETAALSFGAVPSRVPAVLSEEFAGRVGLATGDTVDLLFTRTGRTAPIVVAGVIPAVPGADSSSAALLPLESLTASLFASSGTGLRADQVWAAGAGAAAALERALPEASIHSASEGGSAITSALTAVWWIATAAVAALSAVALAAATAALARRRATDVFVLRALGVTAAAQSRMRMRESTGVICFAVVCGAVGGALAVWLTLPALTLSAVPGVSPAIAEGLTPGFAPLAFTLAAVAIAAIASGAVSARLIARQGRAGRVMEAS